MQKAIDQKLKEIEEAESRELREQVRKGTKIRSAEFCVAVCWFAGRITFWWAFQTEKRRPIRSRRLS